jgi:hypothetical protein
MRLVSREMARSLLATERGDIIRLFEPILRKCGYRYVGKPGKLQDQRSSSS